MKSPTLPCFFTKALPFLMLFFGLLPYLGAQTVDWYIHLGATYIDQIDDHELDSEGNLYVLGRFADEMDFDPGPGETIINHKRNASNNLFAGFIAKYSAEGSLVWVQYLGDRQGVIFPRQLELDEENNALYTAGYYRTRMNFNPDGEDYLYQTGSSVLGDTYLARYTLEGGYVWAKNIGRDGGVKNNVSLEINSEGNLIVHQDVRGRVDIDPGTTNNVWIEDLSADGIEIRQYLARYSPEGELLWSHAFTCTKSNEAGCLYVDESDNIYMAGQFSGYGVVGSIDLDPGDAEQLSTTLVKQGQDFKAGDGFLAKYDKEGNYIWHNTIHTAREVYPEAIALSESGKVYLAGGFRREAGGKADYEKDLVIISGDLTAGFVFRYDEETGAQEDMLTIAYGLSGDTGDEGKHKASVLQIEVDEDDNLYMAGSFAGTRYFISKEDEEGEYVSFTHNGEFDGNFGSDMFLVKYDRDMNLDWLSKIGGDGLGNDYPTGNLSLDDNGGLILSGRFLSEVDIAPGDPETRIQGVEREEALIVRYDLSAEVNFTGLDKRSMVENKALTVFPNPFNDYLVIKFDQPQTENGPVVARMYDPTGREVQNWQLAEQKSELMLNVDDEVKPGIYFLRVEMADGSLVKKTIVRQ